MFELMLVVGDSSSKPGAKILRWQTLLRIEQAGCTQVPAVFSPENSLQNFSAKVFLEEIDVVFCGENPK